MGPLGEKRFTGVSDTRSDP